MAKKQSAVIVFGRLPVEGRVKTRLGKSLDNRPDLACQFYKQCAEAVLCEAAAVATADTIFFFADAGDEEGVRRWVGGVTDGRVECVAQVQAPGLGDRMGAAFNLLFTRGYSRIVIVGTDVPDLDRRVIAAALDALVDKDLVLGDSGDGGYYLLGQKDGSTPELFSDIKYSTGTVFANTVAAAKRAGMDVCAIDVLPTLLDIDTADDLRQWLAAPADDGSVSQAELLAVGRQVLENAQVVNDRPSHE